MGHCKKSKHYRQDLSNRNLKNIKIRARIVHVQSGQACLKDIELLDYFNYFGDKIDYCGHMWVPLKPFKKVINEMNNSDARIVDFNGTVYKYKNKNGETNYSIKEIKNVKHLVDVMSEVALLSHGYAPEQESVDCMKKSHNVKQCQKNADNMMRLLSNDAQLLLWFICKNISYELRFDHYNYFYPQKFNTLIDMLNSCLKNDCSNNDYECLVELYNMTKTMLQFEYAPLEHLKCMMGHTVAVKKKFRDVANEIISILKMYQNEPIILSSYPLVASSNNFNVNQKIASCKIEKLVQKHDDVCQQDIDRVQKMLVDLETNRLNFCGGYYESFRNRMLNLPQSKTVIFTFGMHTELRGVVDSIDNDTICFKNLYEFQRIPNKPEYEKIIESVFENIEDFTKTNPCGINCSSEGFFEIINLLDSPTKIEKANEDILLDIPNLKKGDCIRFRWTLFDLMWSFYEFQNSVNETKNVEELKSNIASFINKKDQELKKKNGSREIYNVQKIEMLIF